MAAENKSIGWVVAMLALGVAYAGWGFLAADYFQDTPGEGPVKRGFFANSLVQLPNFPAVFEHAFQNRLWLIALIVVAEIGVLILWAVMRKVERELARN
jgi:hypothetical protein